MAVIVPRDVVEKDIVLQFVDVSGVVQNDYVMPVPVAENDFIGQFELSLVVKVLAIAKVLVPLPEF